MKENKLTKSNAAQYFAKNLQQIGFSSPTKAFLTTIKEAVDNSLDACEENGILPEIWIEIKRLGPGTTKNTDRMSILVRDNGPGIEPKFVPQVYGEFLASSKFGRGRCSRGQQGIGISSAVVWAKKTTSQGVRVLTKTSKMKKAFACLVEVDLAKNEGLVKSPKEVDATFSHGTEIEFIMDCKMQVNGEAGFLTYIQGTALVNPSMTLHYSLPGEEVVSYTRLANQVSLIPDAVEPHPHTMMPGDFSDHAGVHTGEKTKVWLKTSFSKFGDADLRALVKRGVNAKTLEKSVEKLDVNEMELLYKTIQDMPLLPPSTKSVRQIGEENLAKSIMRVGEVDFFSVVTRKPTICDFKPIQVEVAVARLKDKGGENETSAQVLRFANLVPLQFDKKACVTIQAIESVNWKAYGLNQSRDSLPTGPYIFAISIVSPFLKFKNASKETIDASEELLQEIRLALIQAGQKLAKFIRKETKEYDLEKKLQYIEQFSPILIDCLFDITEEPKSRRAKLEKGLRKVLGRDTEEAEAELEVHTKKLEKHVLKEEANGKK